MSTLHGQVIAGHGRQYRVATADDAQWLCVTRGKKSDAVVGDQVAFKETSAGHGVIEQIAERQSLLHRSDTFRKKLIAANVTQLVVVVACEPSFNPDLVTRCLVAAEDQDMATLIVLNKIDLTDRLAVARRALTPFTALGYAVLELSAHDGAEALSAHLHGHTSVLVGQSGMGKSTLVNALLPEAGAATGEISSALDSGKHTTTHAFRYRLNTDSLLIDSPGLQEFGIHHLDAHAIAHAFPEIRPHLGLCRFRDCRHNREPGCAVRAALDEGRIDPARWASFRRLVEALG